MAQLNNNLPEEFQLDPAKDIVIKMLPNGQVRTAGPLGNKLYCLGMLELAKQSVLLFKPSEEGKPGVVGADASALQQLPEPQFQTRRQR